MSNVFVDIFAEAEWNWHNTEGGSTSSGAPGGWLLQLGKFLPVSMNRDWGVKMECLDWIIETCEFQTMYCTMQCCLYGFCVFLHATFLLGVPSECRRVNSVMGPHHNWLGCYTVNLSDESWMPVEGNLLLRLTECSHVFIELLHSLIEIVFWARNVPWSRENRRNHCLTWPTFNASSCKQEQVVCHGRVACSSCKIVCATVYKHYVKTRGLEHKVIMMELITHQAWNSKEHEFRHTWADSRWRGRSHGWRTYPAPETFHKWMPNKNRRRMIHINARDVKDLIGK